MLVYQSVDITLGWESWINGILRPLTAIGRQTLIKKFGPQNINATRLTSWKGSFEIIVCWLWTFGYSDLFEIYSQTKYCNNLLHLHLESMYLANHQTLQDPPKIWVSLTCSRSTSCPSTPSAMRHRFDGNAFGFSAFGWSVFLNRTFSGCNWTQVVETELPKWLKLIINFLSAMSFFRGIIAYRS